MINLKKALLRLLTIGLFISLPALVSATEKNIAVYYAPNPPVDLLAKFDRVIVEADNVKAEEVAQIRKGGADVFAYVSIGEVSPTRQWYSKVKKTWVLGKNIAWDSDVMDLTNPEWQQFLMAEVITPLWNKGYHGLFLDTLDSFKLFALTSQKQKVQATALHEFLVNVKKQYPEMKFIANRGFDIMPEIADQLDAVMAESLYASWDNGHKEYKTTSEKDQKWLLAQLNNIKETYGLDIIIIDYVPPHERAKANKIAKMIRDNGFIPWVSTPELNYMGVSSVDVKPTKVLALFDSKVDGHDKTAIINKYFKPIKLLNPEGTLELYDIQLGLPTQVVAGQYAAIVTSKKVEPQESNYREWLSKQIKQGVPVRMAKVG